MFDRNSSVWYLELLSWKMSCILKSPSSCLCFFQERLQTGRRRRELPRSRGRPHPYPRRRRRPADDQREPRTGGQGQEACESVPVGTSRDLGLWPFCLQHWAMTIPSPQQWVITLPVTLLCGFSYSSIHVNMFTAVSNHGRCIPLINKYIIKVCKKCLFSLFLYCWKLNVSTVGSTS